MAFYEAHSWAKGMLAGLPEPDAGLSPPSSPPAGFPTRQVHARCSGKRDGDHLAITNASFTSVRLRPHRRAIFPSKKKKKLACDAQVPTNRAPSHELQTAGGLRRSDSCIPARGESDKAAVRRTCSSLFRRSPRAQTERRTRPQTGSRSFLTSAQSGNGRHGYRRPTSSRVLNLAWEQR